MKCGDAVFTTNIKDERQFGWVGYKAPTGKRFVMLLLGTVEKDAEDFDVDAALNALGWFYTPKASPAEFGNIGADGVQS